MNRLKWLGSLGIGHRSVPLVEDHRVVLAEVADTGELPKDERSFARAVTAVCLEIAPLQGVASRDARPFSQAKIGEFEIFVRQDTPSGFSVMVRHNAALVFGSSPNVVHQAIPGPWCKELLDLRPVVLAEAS